MFQDIDVNIYLFFYTHICTCVCTYIYTCIKYELHRLSCVTSFRFLKKFFLIDLYLTLHEICSV